LRFSLLNFEKIKRKSEKLKFICVSFIVSSAFPDEKMHGSGVNLKWE